MIEIPIRAASVANLREHWRVRAARAKEHRATAHWAMKAAVKPQLPCIITLTRLGPRTLDTDNLASSMKAARDGIADWLGVDDGDARVQWRYAQRKSKKYSVTAEIAEVPISTLRTEKL